MTTIQAAKNIHAQTGARWCDCMRWAAQCKHEALAKEAQEREAYYVARREELRGIKWRARLSKAAPTLEGARATEGQPGMGIAYHPPTKQEAA